MAALVTFRFTAALDSAAVLTLSCGRCRCRRNSRRRRRSRASRSPELGCYTIDSGRLIIRMQDRAPKLVTDPPRNGVLTINAMTYRRR